MSNRAVILGASGAFVLLLTLGPVWAFPLAERVSTVTGSEGVEPDPATTDPATTDPATTDPATTEPPAIDGSGTEAVDPGSAAIPGREDDLSGQPARAQAEMDLIVAPSSLVSTDGTLADTAEAMVAFDVIASLMADEALTVALIGHTDSTGDATANLLASQRLAEAAGRRLIERGVSAERVFSFGQGEAQPVATNDTEEGRARNRRLEVVFGVSDT